MIEKLTVQAPSEYCLGGVNRFFQSVFRIYCFIISIGAPNIVGRMEQVIVAFDRIVHVLINK